MMTLSRILLTSTTPSLRLGLTDGVASVISCRCIYQRRSFHDPSRKPSALPPRIPFLVSSYRTFSEVPQKSRKDNGQALRENIYTIPNALTLSRILACPLLGWTILEGRFMLATGILLYAGASDWLDGFLARRYQMRTVLGTILDPAADKTLMTTLTVTLAMKGLLPIPLAVIILGRDVLLSLAAFYIRYKTLPKPKSLRRYWDFSIPSAEVRPTQISKVNTALQLLLMGVTTVSPFCVLNLSIPLQVLQWTVTGTTVWSGLSYVFSKDAVQVVSSKLKKRV